MKKSTRIVKRFLSLVLVVLMSINTFGAIVSDNDGSAFITKAEFASSNTKDYSLIQWGANTGTNIYCFADDIKATLGTQKSLTIPKAEFNALYYSTAGGTLQKNSANSYTLKYTPIEFKPTDIAAKNFLQEYVTSIAGEKVFLGGGAPILRSEDEQKIQLKFKFKARHAGNHQSNSTTNVYLKLSNKQFTNSDFSTNSKQFVNVTTQLAMNILAL